MQDFTGHPLSARSPVTSRLPSILCHVFSVGSKKAALSGQCRLAGVSVCVAVRWEPSPLANTWPAHLPALHPPSLNHELLLRSNAESIRAICKFGAVVLLTHLEWLTMLSRQQQTTWKICSQAPSERPSDTPEGVSNRLISVFLW